MTDHHTAAARGLYAAILESPWDDFVRRCYADEIEPYEPERAEWIRFQLGAVKLSNPGSVMEAIDKSLLTHNFDGDFKMDGVKVEVSRGFPHAVAMTMQSFMGGECEPCGGYGHTELFPYFKCKPCHGTGRIPPLAATLCATWPVTSIRFSDYHPTPHSGDYWIIDEEVCDMIPTIDRELVYATDDDATVALSNGAVNFSRQKVGFSPLIW